MVEQSSPIVSSRRQVALVTGSSGGIGASVVAALRARGDLVLGADRAPLQDQDIDGFYRLDVTDEQQTTDIVEQIVAEHGRVDVLVHATGVLGGTPDPLQTTTEEFERVMRINATGTFTITREVANVMRDRGTKGTILLLSSVAAKEARTTTCRTTPARSPCCTSCGPWRRSLAPRASPSTP